MKTYRPWATLLAATCLLSLAVPTASSQGQPGGAPAQPGAGAAVRPPAAVAAGAAPRSNVAVIDLAAVFKTFNKYQAQREQLTTDLGAADDRAKQQGEQLRAMAERLKEYNKSSAEFDKLETEIQNTQADFEIQLRQQRKEFILRESKIMAATLDEVMQEVQYFAERNGIAMIMRAFTEKVDPAEPEQVVRELNEPIVYHAPSLDITQIVVDQLNRKFPAARPAGTAPRQALQPPAGGAPRPR